MKPMSVPAPHQPECKTCPRFSILRSPCRPEACIFRQNAPATVLPTALNLRIPASPVGASAP